MKLEQQHGQVDWGQQGVIMSGRNHRSFFTKPTDIAKYFNDCFIGKISKSSDDMPATNADTTHPSISNQIMKHTRIVLLNSIKSVWKR